MAYVSYLTIDHAPNRTTYFVGDKFEKYGMVVKAHYTDGTSSTVDFFAYSPTSSLTTSNTQVTISALDKTVTQNITVLPAPTKGYFVNAFLGNANYGNNPYVNTVDGSISFYNNPITVERDSYQINVILSYHSRMTDRESDLIKGLFKGFRTNYHQFLIADGTDENNNTTYKYIDGNGYIHTFIYHSEFSKYFDKEGAGLCLDINDKTITDEQNNILTFDTSGRLISIQSGLNSSDIKVIEYNSDGLRKIYDNRNPNVYIKFSYNFTYLQYIRVYYNDDNTPLKTYTLNGFFGQISSIEETVGNNTRTLYQYAVNDRDRVRRVVDCLTKIAYRITYTFDTVLNDYRFDSLRKGYLNNDTFVQHEGIYFVGYNHNANSPYKLIREFVIRNDNDIDLSFMTDSNGNPVSVFEQEYDNEGNYYSLIHDEGIWLGNEGDSGDRISDSTAKSFSGTITISGLNVTKNDLNESPTLKLVGYIKIKSNHLRAKLSINGTYITSRFIDINPDAHYVWQYFELPLTREIGNNKTISSFDIYLEDENDSGINAEIANLQFAKSEARQRLFFMNNNEPVALDELTQLNLEQQNGSYGHLYLDTDIMYLSESDFLHTLKRYYSRQDSPSLLYLNNGKIIKAFYDDFYASYSPTNALYFLEDDCSNDILGESNNWFFATSLNAKAKTYYRFKSHYYEVIVRTQITDNPATYEETTTRYNYKDQTTLEINKNNVKTHYEYFADGTLKKKGIGDFDNDGITFIYSAVLYEAILDNNNKYISRVAQEGKGFDYQYSNDLLSKKIINDLYQGQPVNQYFSIEYVRDGFLSDLCNVKFKNISTIEEEHNYSRPSVSYKTNYINDTVSKYRINKNIDNQSTVLGIHDGTDYVNILITQKTVSSTTRTYNNSYSYGGGNQVVVETFDIYNRPASITVNGDPMVSFQYESQHASQFCALLSGITDNFTERNISYTYDSNNRLISTQVGSFAVTYSTDGDYSCTELAFDNSEKYLSKVKDSETLYKKGNNIINSSYWKYNYDSFLRLSTKLNNKFSHNIFQEYSYSNDYPSRMTQYSYDGNVYKETYSYSQFYGHLTGVSISTSSFSSTSTYQYDGFGRLVSETNTKLGINRTYIYKPSSNIPGPVGRMTKFGNDELIYDDRGRLVEFGDNFYGYDEYGNRISKNADSYQWTRGHLLSCLGFSRYYYDYNGIRSSKLDSDGLTHNYYYHGNNLVGEDVYNGNILVRKLRFFYDKDGLCSFRTIIGNQTKDYIYIRNPFKDIVGISEGITLKALYVYDAWGNHKVYNPNGTVNTDASFVGNINPFRYRSYYYDSDTNLYYLRSRYYDPEIGQFISPDDMECLAFDTITGINLYSYCYYSPTRFIDETGSFAISLTTLIVGVIVGAVVGAGIGFGTAAYNDYREDGIWFNGDWTDYLGKTLGGAVAGAGIGLAGVLGAGVGAAMLAEETLTIAGITLSGGTALTAAAIGSFTTGVGGYLVRTGISRKENFELSDMFIEGIINMASGIVSFVGAFCGGACGVKVPGLFSFSNFVKYQIASSYFGVLPIKIMLAYLKKRLEELY